jgi:hypothetical protein
MTHDNIQYCQGDVYLFRVDALPEAEKAKPVDKTYAQRLYIGCGTLDTPSRSGSVRSTVTPEQR